MDSKSYLDPLGLRVGAVNDIPFGYECVDWDKKVVIRQWKTDMLTKASLNATWGGGNASHGEAYLRTLTPSLSEISPGINAIIIKDPNTEINVDITIVCNGLTEQEVTDEVQDEIDAWVAAAPGDKTRTAKIDGEETWFGGMVGWGDWEEEKSKLVLSMVPAGEGDNAFMAWVTKNLPPETIPLPKQTGQLEPKGFPLLRCDPGDVDNYWSPVPLYTVVEADDGDDLIVVADPMTLPGGGIVGLSYFTTGGRKIKQRNREHDKRLKGQPWQWPICKGEVFVVPQNDPDLPDSAGEALDVRCISRFKLIPPE